MTNSNAYLITALRITVPSDVKPGDPIINVTPITPCHANVDDQHRALQIQVLVEQVEIPWIRRENFPVGSGDSVNVKVYALPGSMYLGYRIDNSRCRLDENGVTSAAQLAALCIKSNLEPIVWPCNDQNQRKFA
ncbi:MAG: hypothetical protein EVA65_13480 [Oceanococcus sp.]|nr:MAG: hypothetical protein EVA65_13480 [Oceanococcus sp.]